MTVESLSHWLHKIAELPAADGAAVPRDVLHRIEAALHPFLGLTLEAFAELLGKVKKPKAPPKPKKTDEEKAAEKAEKAEAKRVAREAEKTRKADEAKRKKDDAVAAKLAAKERAAVEKVAKATAAKAAKVAAKDAAKADATAAKLAKKTADAGEKAAPLLEAAKVVADDLRELTRRFTGGGVAKATVDAGLAALQPLSKVQLLHVARLLESDAGLSETTSKPHLIKALQTMVLRVWKTSDNVNH